jgi:hypothetical protein
MLLFEIDSLNFHERTNETSQLISLTAQQHSRNEAYFLLTLLKEKKVNKIIFVLVNFY